MVEKRKSFLLYLILFSFAFLNFKCDTTEPPDDKPGRRDYIWTADTLWSEEWIGITDVWGSSPNSIWITAGASSAKDCLWHYDEINWSKSSQVLTPSLNTVFGANSDEVWIGDSFGTFWRNTGTGWQKFQQVSLNGFDRIVITSIYGSTSNNLYAVGFADQYSGTDYKDIIFKYDGTEWKLLNIPDMKVGFNDIKRISNGKYLIWGSNVDNGFNDRLYVYDGTTTIKEIYSDYYYPGLYEMNGNVYITINKKIYKCKNDKLELWKEFTGTTYYGTVLGRSEKDFFGAGYDGILHYNGTDLVTLYPTQLELHGALIFEKDVFFTGYNTTTHTYIIIRGTLQEE